MHALAKNIRPRDICTREAFDNAATRSLATGGSTNAALHLPAMAHEAELSTPFKMSHVSSRSPLHR